MAAPPEGTIRSYDLSQIFNLVEVSGFVWFLPEFVARRFPRPGTAYRPVVELEPVTLKVVWPATSRSAAVAAFVRTAQAAVLEVQPVM